MNTFKTLQTLGISVATFALVLSAGCGSSKVHGEKFPDQDAPRASRNFAEVQAARGARNDAMLYDRHFSGDALNSLGQAKLDLMLKDDEPANPLTVYLNVPHATVEGRDLSVKAYLKDNGLKDEQIKLVEGANPAVDSPAAVLSDGLAKMEAAGGAGAATGGTAAK